MEGGRCGAELSNWPPRAHIECPYLVRLAFMPILSQPETDIELPIRREGCSTRRQITFGNGKGYALNRTGIIPGVEGIRSQREDLQVAGDDIPPACADDGLPRRAKHR